MPRATNNPASRARRKKYMKAAKGNFGKRKNVLRNVIETVEKGMVYATIHRHHKKRNMRSLWIVRINAAAREHGMSYSQFIHALKKADIHVNRKVLSDLAMNDAPAFEQLLQKAKTALAQS